jgi:hypothetical protein
MALPAGATQSQWQTIIKNISIQDLQKMTETPSGVEDFKYKKILGVIAAKDQQNFRQLKAQREINPNNTQLKVDFEDCLLKSFCSEFLQIRSYKVDSKTQKRELVVTRICKAKESESKQPNDPAYKNTIESEFGLASNCFVLSNFSLKKNIH